MPEIYIITCHATGRSYVGSTMNTFNKRYPRGEYWRFTSNRELRGDCAKYGTSQTSYEILEVIEGKISSRHLKNKERLYIQKLNTFLPHGYNSTLPYCSEMDIYSRDLLNERKRKQNLGYPWRKGESYESISERVSWELYTELRQLVIKEKILRFVLNNEKTKYEIYRSPPSTTHGSSPLLF